MWDYGAPGIVRRGDTVFAAGLDTIPGVKPLHNCRWALHRRAKGGWDRAAADEKGRQREPCPIVIFEDGRLFLSTNPTLTEENAYSGPADPHLLEFSAKDLGKPPSVLRPVWSGNPRLTEHTYRGLGADARNRELLILHNDGSGAPRAHWSFLDRRGKWSNQGVIEYPVRGCYPQVALRNGAAHVLAIGDIMEPIAEWRKFKFEQSGGRQWDYVFRRLFYARNSEVGSRAFGAPVEIDNVDRTAGHITNLDLWLDDEGAAHLLYLKRNIASPVMRDRFFPGTPITVSLEYRVVKDGSVAGARTLLTGGEEAESERPVYARFHAAPKGRLFVFASVESRGKHENRLLDMSRGAAQSGGGKVELQYPFLHFMTATERGGSRPSEYLDVLGTCAGAPHTTMRYARIRL